MSLLERISRGAGRLLEIGMKGAGLVTAVDELLIHPGHATALQVLLSAVLLMGGQATKDLVFGVVDRIMEQGGQRPSEPTPAPEQLKERREG